MLEATGREEMFLHLVTSPARRKGGVAGDGDSASHPLSRHQAAVGASSANLWEAW